MEIAEQRDRKAIQTGGPALQSDLLPHDSRKVGLEESSLGRQRGHSGSRRQFEEFSTVERKKGQSFSNPVAPALRHTQHTPSARARHRDPPLFVEKRNRGIDD
jgi:hypothetical protein